jgi:ubiquinone/menaquinone biosynthesis C-methylase UbiE
MGMHPNDRSRLTFLVRYATRHPERIAPHARRLARDAVLRLKSRDHVSYYRAVMKSDAARSDEAAVGSHTHESWLKLGQMQFDYLVSHGLKPGMRMLEIGCGNLRAGRLFIDHLDAGDYYGIDISPDILLAAQRTLAETGLQGRLPHLTLVSDLKLAFLPSEYFDVVHAHSVFSHSPVEVIEECLAHVGRVMKPGGFFDFTFDRTDGAEHHVLREDFYYRTETLVALAGRYGLAGQFMTDWEELPHQQSKLRVTRPAGLRYISFREADRKGMRWRRPTGVLGLMGHRAVRRPALLTAKETRSCSAFKRRSPRGAWTIPSSTSGCGRLSSLARTPTWTSCSPTCPRRRPRPARRPWPPAAARAGSRSR